METRRYHVTLSTGHRATYAFTPATRDNRPCVIVAITNKGRTACECIPVSSDTEKPFADWCTDWLAASIDPAAKPTWGEI